MADTERNSHIRFWIIAVLFIVSSINYASRATLSFAAVPLAKEIHISTVQLGYIFSAFGWSYVIGQIPGGALLDKYGSRPIYLWSITLWAVFTGMQAFVSSLSVVPVFISLFALRFALGFAECPSFPANARIVANWFPNSERGTASAIFNASQYFSLVAFAPLMGFLAQNYGWRSVFLAMGGIGLVGAAIFWAVVQSPSRHKGISKREYDYIEANGALVNLDRPAAAAQTIRWGIIGQLLANRMLLGIYLAQYSITALTYFYATWFPIYLIKARGMSLTGAGFASAGPAIAGFVGGVLGGIVSDLLLRKGMSLSNARKIPILVGLVISCAILLCNYTDSQALIMTFMAIAFFGKGVAALGWAVMSDAAPREATGLSGSIFNLFGNAAGIFTPIGIGYILAETGNNWDMALLFVFAHSIVAMISYLFITGEIKRVVLKA
ncbi:MAG: sugar (glucarate) transporter permease [Alphaproteobacteria bacterium]|nr:sugar (glucarate) transporter permease [Alphaproteobacteria bacterium]